MKFTNNLTVQVLIGIFIFFILLIVNSIILNSSINGHVKSFLGLVISVLAVFAIIFFKSIFTHKKITSIRSVKTLSKITIVALLFVLISLVVSILVAYFENPSESDSVSSMIDDIISNFRSSIVISIIFAALMEELLFRYYILSILVKRGINQYLAILISSLLFSIIHIFSYNVYVLIYITFLGIGFGMLYILIKNIGAPLGLHFTINYLAAIYEANEEYNPSNFIDVIIGNSTLNWYLLLIMLAWVLNLIIRKQTLNKL